MRYIVIEKEGYQIILLRTSKPVDKDISDFLTSDSWAYLEHVDGMLVSGDSFFHLKTFKY